MVTPDPLFNSVQKYPPLGIKVMSLFMISTFGIRGLGFMDNLQENVLFAILNVSIGLGLLIAVYGLWTIQTWGIPFTQSLYVLDYVVFVSYNFFVFYSLDVIFFFVISIFYFLFIGFLHRYRGFYIQ